MVWLPIEVSRMFCKSVYVLSSCDDWSGVGLLASLLYDLPRALLYDSPRAKSAYLKLLVDRGLRGFLELEGV